MATAPPPGTSPAVFVVAGEEDTRVLLRGLLRLHHHRVVGEAEGVTEAIERLGQQPLAILIVDTNLAEGSALDLVQHAKRSTPDVRVILIAHGIRPDIPEGSSQPDSILQRPFRLRDFAVALGPSAAGPTASTPAAGPGGSTRP